MHDNLLIAIALATAALGIVGLLFALAFLDVPLSSVGDVEAMVDGNPASVTAKVVSVRTAGEMGIVTVRQESSIDVTVPLETTEELHAGDCVLVSGKKGSYKGRTQLSANLLVKC